MAITCAQCTQKGCWVRSSSVSVSFPVLSIAVACSSPVYIVDLATPPPLAYEFDTSTSIISTVGAIYIKAAYAPTCHILHFICIRSISCTMPEVLHHTLSISVKRNYPPAAVTATERLGLSCETLRLTRKYSQYFNREGIANRVPRI